MVKSWTGTYKHRYRAAYALPGVLTWSIVTVAMVGFIAYPRSWVVITSAFMCYFVARMVLSLVFYAIGRARVREWERTDWASYDSVPGPAGFAPADVYHVVIIPTYKEPIEILERTLDALSVQHRARERVIPVIAMEEREVGAREKGAALAEKYAVAFAEIFVTVHPPDLPGEIPGKSSNMSWAASEVYPVLVGERGIAAERITVTSCDADSVLHPLYFEAVSDLFANDQRRYGRFWQAPLHFDNNLWQVPAPIRVTAWIAHAGQMAELAMPFYEPLPISTYTLSFRTAVECGLWDPMVISEDWHAYLNVMFERGGDVGLTPVFLPTKGDAVDGETFLAGLKARHDQVMRHSWGAEDAGFLLARMVQQRWWHRRAVFRFGQVLHDHVSRATAWFFIVSTYLLLGYAEPLFTNDLTRIIMVHPGVPYLREIFVVGAAALVTTVIAELIRTPPPADRRPVSVIFELAVAWLTLPVVGFYLGTLPALRAQTRLMLGMPFSYKVTEKRAVPAPEAV
ncbi:MAG: glycosyltransferase family 2 protein [Clostridiales bacterium]|nr:glycosyltransferase family 2 protein [Clostridiales bacterium]